MGSPPRMRGQACLVKTTFLTWRITPADAGTSEFFTECCRGTQDHPRGCGDKD